MSARTQFRVDYFTIGVVTVLLLSQAHAQTEGLLPNSPPNASPLASAAPTASASTIAAPGLDDAALAAQQHAEGVLFIRARKLDAAITLLRSAIALDPKNAIYVTDLGYAYLKQRRFVEAEAEFKRAIALEPTRYHAYEHLEPSITLQPERWEKRGELLAILDRGLELTRSQDTHLRISLARIRAERAFGLVDRARAHLDALLQRQVPRALEKPVQELKVSLDQDRKARALRDWPEPSIEPTDQARFDAVERDSAGASPSELLTTLSALCAKYPAWRAPRWLRATRLTAQGHYDEAVKELTVLTRLAPSNPHYHRLLGTLLAEHGGLLELDRAYHELHSAYTLEPEWTELIALRNKLAARRSDTSNSTGKEEPPTTHPTDNAVRLYEEAEANLEATPEEREGPTRLLEQALRESPSFVDAATLLYVLTERVHEPTVVALWNDSAGLFTLYRKLSRMSPAVARTITEPWLDRAIERGNVDARLTRALGKKSQGNAKAAELELSNYLALVSNPEEVEAVLTLRAELAVKGEADDTRLLTARVRLQQDDTDGALTVLDAPCASDMGTPQLLALGIVYERADKPREALDCYNMGVEHSPTEHELGRRGVRLLARGDVGLFSHAFTQRVPQLVDREPAALWVLARQALARGNGVEAESYAASYLARASATDRFVAEAKALQQELTQQAQAHVAAEGKRRRQLQQLSVASAFGLGLAAYLFLFRGMTLARAIRRRTRIFPGLARIIGELRHDVFKHRTSALELLKDGQTTVEKLRATMLEPIPTSEVVTEAYARLVTHARAHGITLRRLPREPVFGRLVSDLELVERKLNNTADRNALLKLDVRLRTVHLDRLSNLLVQGPRTSVDAALLQRWIAAVAAEHTAQDATWITPALQMSDPVLAFPIDKSALFQIFSNLLRNAEHAVRGVAVPRVQVGLMRVTDFTGQTLVRLQVSDNAATPFNSETIERQDPRRGLGIVRETTRDWNGILTVLPESAPYAKAVGVQFAQ